MSTAASSSVRQARQALGLRLREIRKDAGLTARELARRAGWHESKCSRLEHGRTPPSDADIQAWTEHCGAAQQAADLIATARGIDGMYVEWRRLASSGLRRVQEASVPLYERTRHFRVYEPGVVPGLFQTRAYASAMLSTAAALYRLPDDTEEAVDARLARQRVVHHGDHRFAVVIEESVLHSRVGGVDTMTGQLGSLIAAASLPRVSLGIIPAASERTIWPAEGFWIFDDERVLVELTTAEVTVTQPREVALYARAFAALADLAVYGAAARSLVTASIDALG